MGLVVPCHATPFQADVPLSMFVFPVRTGVALPEVFAQHAARPAQPLEVPPAAILKALEASGLKEVKRRTTGSYMACRMD